jgi:hypothetical protein
MLPGPAHGVGRPAMFAQITEFRTRRVEEKALSDHTV